MDQITWDNYRDIGEFFKRKKGEMLMGKPLDDDFYGIEFQVGKGYDFFTTSTPTSSSGSTAATSGTRRSSPTPMPSASSTRRRRSSLSSTCCRS